MGAVPSHSEDWYMISSPLVYDAALAVWRNAKELHESMKGSRMSEEQRRLLEKALASSASPGLYRHWKSTPNDARFCLVRRVEFVGEFRQPEVVYVPLYGEGAGKEVRRNLLSAEDGFLAPVHRPNGPPFPYEGQRFRLVGTFPPGRIDTLCGWAEGLARVRSEREVIEWLSVV